MVFHQYFILVVRVQNTMGLSCLRAVHQAYEDRAKAEKMAAKMEKVLVMKEQREAAKDRIRNYHEDQRLRAAKTEEHERKWCQEAIERRNALRTSYLDSQADARRQTTQRRQRRSEERAFLHEFAVQNTSISNALLRHDRHARTEDQQQEREDAYKAMRDTEKEQQDIVRRYLEHRQLMRQTESAMQRAALDTKMLQEANDRLMEAKTRVAQQKARSATVEAFYKLPSADGEATHLPPVSRRAMAASREATNVDRFETNAVAQQGRVGKHHVQVTF